jgi:hypothetical protein
MPLSASVDRAVLRDLVRARDELDRARRRAKWIRKSKELHRATRAVELSALAAHHAGLSWNEIGDLLGIERAMTAEVIPIAGRSGDVPNLGAAVAF